MTKPVGFYEAMKRFASVIILFVAIDTVAILVGHIIPSHPADTRLAESFIVMMSAILALIIGFSSLNKLKRRYKQSSYLDYLSNVDPAVLADAAKSPELSDQSRILIVNYLRQNHPQRIR